MSNRIVLDRQARGNKLSMGEQGSGEAALVKLYRGSTTIDNVLQDIDGSLTVRGNINCLGVINDTEVVPPTQGIPTGGTTGQVLKKYSNDDYDAVWEDESGGSSLPAGGSTGQSLVKSSSADNDVAWSSIMGLPSGGTTSQVLVKNSNTNYDVKWDNAATPGPAVNEMKYDPVAGKAYYWNGSTWVEVSIGGGGHQYILLQDQKSSGTNGGSLSTGNVWFQRDLNTVVHDDTGGVSVSGNNFTIPAGTYEVYVQSPFIEQNQAARVRVRLYNVTNNTALIYGASHSPAMSNVNGVSPSSIVTINGIFTLTSSKTLRVDMYSTDNVGASYSLGAATGISGVPEVYTQVELRKTA